MRIYADFGLYNTRQGSHSALPVVSWRGIRRGIITAPEMHGRMSWIDDFYKSKAWLRKRKKILRRDKYLCVRCKRYGRRGRDGLPVAAEIVHHKIPLEVDPSKKLDDENLESLCKACHNKEHPEKGAPPGRRRGNARVP